MLAPGLVGALRAELLGGERQFRLVAQRQLTPRLADQQDGGRERLGHVSTNRELNHAEARVQLSEMDREWLRALTREELEDLMWQLVEVARSLANRVEQNSTNSSRPPSSNDPYRRRGQRQQARNDKADHADDADGDAAGLPSTGVSKPAKPAGKRPGCQTSGGTSQWW